MARLTEALVEHKVVKIVNAKSEVKVKKGKFPDIIIL